LGRVIKAHRERLSWTQERLAGAADVNQRTVQRAEAGQGISKDGLGAIAAAFNLDEKDLVKEARSSGAAPPEKRFPLRKLASGRELVEVLNQTAKKGRSLEIGLPEEHDFNEFIGEDILALSEQIENSKADRHSPSENSRYAQHIITICGKMGFSLFAGNYREELKSKEGSRTNTTVQIIAAPNSDPRIRKVANGLVLDLVRDSRRLLHGRFLSGHTAYDWMHHQLLAKSDGEERVRETLRRMLAETIQEMRTGEGRKGESKK
jgi:transcriptional regulator with XRE-family HTH domain